MVSNKREWRLGYSFLCHSLPTAAMLLLCYFRTDPDTLHASASTRLWIHLFAMLMLSAGHLFAFALYPPAATMPFHHVYILSAAAGFASVLAYISFLVICAFTVPRFIFLMADSPFVGVALTTPAVSIVTSLGLTFSANVVQPAK
jgi:hypothetical protein